MTVFFMLSAEIVLFYANLRFAGGLEIHPTNLTSQFPEYPHRLTQNQKY